MATVTTIHPVTRAPSLAARVAASQTAFLACCTALAFLLLGYHPYAEDGGIYSAAAALRVDPSLFPSERAFAVGQTGLSLFIPMVLAFTRVTHLSLRVATLLLHVFALAVTLTAAFALARVLFHSDRTQRWAVLTLAVSLGVPVAGTSLYLCDPYLNARSFFTPLLLLATTALLRRRDAFAVAFMLIAFALHPLMALCGTVPLLLLWARRSSRPLLLSAIACAAVLSVMGAVHRLSPIDTAAAHAASLTRKYWFLSGWAWYEVVGIVAPILLLMHLAQRHAQGSPNSNQRNLAIAAAMAVLTVGVGALLFVHTKDHGLLLARMQPLRLLHPVYAFMVLLLGGRIAESQYQRVAWIPIAGAAAALIAMQLSTYPESQHVELPGRPSTNAWVQAFQWAGMHTPASAVFALDANYTSSPGEDAQLFRAIALRSELPDAAKDGGISSVMPELASRWLMASQAQIALDTATDSERVARIAPLGATWIVLSTTAATSFECPYINKAVKVCRLP